MYTLRGPARRAEDGVSSSRGCQLQSVLDGDDVKHLDFQVEVRVGRDEARDTLLSIGKSCRHSTRPFPPLTQLPHGNVPPLDDLAHANLKNERPRTLVTAVDDLPVTELLDSARPSQRQAPQDLGATAGEGRGGAGRRGPWGGEKREKGGQGPTEAL